VFAPSIWHGPTDRREIALTFDDGPSESTPELLDVLARHKVKATFFVCGMHVRRLPDVAREIIAAGHEPANHTENHARLWLRSPAFIHNEVAAAQAGIADVCGKMPRLFRAPYGVRWPGLGNAQRAFGLTGVMWTVIGNDWALPGDAIAARVLKRAGNGGIVCLHDGRERQTRPDISATINAVRELVPMLSDQGYSFRTVSEWL
jgi:peptidoglycan/xylan/chitin deacetylase (PgdA/CDA1 family)